MGKLTCIIVEDEPLAREVLRDYINQVPHLDLKGEYADALFALDGLQNEQIDVIFLDIHLPRLKGLDFIRILKVRPQIILTTAYHEYAVESFELAVTDYLLKPIEFERFLMAVGKLKAPEDTIQAQSDLPVGRRFQFFRVNRNNVKIYLADILFVESLKDYVRIHTPEDKFITKGQLGEMINRLNEIDLIRVHRSFAVAKAHVDAYSNVGIQIGKINIPIGRSYRELVRRDLSTLP